MDILRRINLLDVEDEPDGMEPSSMGFLGELTAEQVEGMSVEDLMAKIGPEALKRFEEDVQKNPEFIEAALKAWRPWWVPQPKVQEESRKNETKVEATKSAPKRLPCQDPIPEPLEELPPLSALAKQRPSENIWNNLIELVYLYCYLNRMYAGDLLGNAMEFSRNFLAISSVLNSNSFTHPSVIHALRATEASVVMESTFFMSEETKSVIIDDLMHIFRSASHVQALLASLQRTLERSVTQKKGNFFAAKKVYFYNVWFADELRTDPDLVYTTLTSMLALISGFKAKRVDSK